jgi:hypothetical protein
VLAAGCSATLASPQQGPTAYKGKFKLPFPTQWGGTTLPAGDYTFKIESTAWPVMLTVRQAGPHAKTYMIWSGSISERNFSEQSALMVVRNSGSLVVRSLRLREIGVEYRFQVPKGQTMLAQGPELIERIEILEAKN